MWWGFGRAGGEYDFAAEGDKRQMIYVSPQKRVQAGSAGAAALLGFT